MGIGSITLGVLSFLCMLGGIVLSFVPFLGPMLAFLSPALALLGIVFGGVALSRAREGGGENESLAIGGLVTSIIAFVPATLVALTCGVCGTCWTGIILTPHDAGPPGAIFPDGGTPSWAPTTPTAPPPFPSTYPGVPSGVPSTPPPMPLPPPVVIDPGAVPPTAPTAPPIAPTAPPIAPPTAPNAPPIAPTAPPTSTAPPTAPGVELPPPPLPPGPNVRAGN